MGRAPCCDKANVKRGPWSPEEDAELKSYIEKHGTGGNWIALPQKIGLKRCGKSCRLRWLNYLRPNIKHGGFSEEEDRVICSLYISIGSRWSIIAAQLPGRTDNDIKNYWNTKLKKKLLGKPRKDKPCQRRVGNNNKAINEAFKVSPYWPQPPPVPEVYPTPVDWNAHNDQGSIRKLLINISTAPQFCSNTPSIGLVNSSSSSSATTTSSSPVEAPEATTNCFSTELDDMIYGNPMKLDGLDGMFGVENMVINGGSGNCGDSSLEAGLNWNIGDNISPLVYPPLISNYINGVHQQCNILEEQARLGSHC